MPSRKLTVILFCALIVFSSIIVFLYRVTYPAKVIINDVVFYVEVADTIDLLEKGLSGHAPLSPNQGMLFVFREPITFGFWMKDMLFSIDIIWIDSNWKISSIDKSISPNTFPKKFFPKNPSIYVLEIPAGQSDKFNLKIGDTVKFIKK